MKKIYLLLVTMSLSCMIVYGQQTVLDNTSNWVSVENIDLYSGQALHDTFRITITKTELTLANDDISRVFNIENIVGSWAEVNTEGQLSFDLLIGGFRGKGIVQNEGGIVSLTIDFSERKDWMKKKFIVKN